MGGKKRKIAILDYIHIKMLWMESEKRKTGIKIIQIEKFVIIKKIDKDFSI